MGYVLVEEDKYLGDFASAVGLSDLVDAASKTPYTELNSLLENGYTEDAAKVNKEIQRCVQAYGKKFKPPVIESLVALANALSKSKTNTAQIEEG